MTNKGGGAARGGAGCGDAFTVMLQEARRQEATQRDCRLTGPIRGLLPALPPPAAEVVVDGIYLPPSPLTTTADIAYVLNQVRVKQSWGVQGWWTAGLHACLGSAAVGNSVQMCTQLCRSGSAPTPARPCHTSFMFCHTQPSTPHIDICTANNHTFNM